ncbi:hypothetical protein [Bowmanella denitrificans]|uniref:hypothetical protein n=1 Tax=Bowmanella denitrificans TaxID=366582 RepID=UPI0015599F76|nr:hypothetical protein [Bowmanella denitrificans]
MIMMELDVLILLALMAALLGLSVKIKGLRAKTDRHERQLKALLEAQAKPPIKP